MKRFAVVAALALAVAPSSAQQGVFRSASDRAGLRHGRRRRRTLVPDLTRETSEIPDGKKQTLSIFITDVQPVSVVIMLDTSGSMTASLDLLKSAAEKFVIRLLPEDRARIGSFSDKIVLSPQFTNNRDSLVRYLRESVDYGNPTRLWDASYVSLDTLANETNRRVVCSSPTATTTTAASMEGRRPENARRPRTT